MGALGPPRRTRRCAARFPALAGGHDLVHLSMRSDARSGTRDGTHSGTRDPAEQANRNALYVERAFVGGGNFIPRLNPECANRNARTRNAERTPERANQIV